MILSWIHMAALQAEAATVFYSLNDVILEDDTQITGIFSWTYDTGDFENGLGQFTSLVIPWTWHNQDDLEAVFDIGGSIEITLPGSVHDDGVDISLFLLQPLTATNASPIDLARSKYQIGGNGFHDGLFLSGSIAPTNSVLSLRVTSPGMATLSWEPELPGFVLQETPKLTPPVWTNSASGSTNPVVIPLSAPAKFYRLAGP